LELKFLIWDYLAQLNKEGKTIFLTTHYMEEAERLCKTIGIINHGQIIKIGEKKQILQDKSLEEFFLESTGKD
jgi:ABC-2 type transport system ATP-binding protein